MPRGYLGYNWWYRNTGIPEYLGAFIFTQLTGYKKKLLHAYKKFCKLSDLWKRSYKGGLIYGFPEWLEMDRMKGYQ